MTERLESYKYNIPVLAVAGNSGSGKTTLIEKVLPYLIGKGLRVAVIKHDVHGLNVDHPGKDSARLFEAGADVFLQGPDESLQRCHDYQSASLATTILRLSPIYDLVIVEGFKQSPLQKVWLLGDSEEPPVERHNIIGVLDRNIDRAAWLLDYIDDWLPTQWRQTKVFGAILIGGKSTRMGQPKHLIEVNGRAWLEHTIEQLKDVVDEVVIVGAGDIPAHISAMRLPDVPGLYGPLSGILAAMRWAPHAGWLVCACDLPRINSDALRWLLKNRAPGVWGVIPRLSREGVEPLLAYYDWRAGRLFESIATDGRCAPHLIAQHNTVATPRPPANLASAWTNVNSPVDMSSLIRNMPALDFL
jgi:molybdopterin-guanine dinucleotide biosynthesis protein MobB